MPDTPAPLSPATVRNRERQIGEMQPDQLGGVAMTTTQALEQARALLYTGQTTVNNSVLELLARKIAAALMRAYADGMDDVASGSPGEVQREALGRSRAIRAEADALERGD